MRKIYCIITAVLWLGSLMFAQSPANRTVSTTVADVLAQMPAARQTIYNKLLEDLTATGKEGVLLLIDRLRVPATESSSKVEYALSGLTHFVMAKGYEEARLATVQGYIEGLEKVEDREIKAFIIRQLQEVGKDESVEVLAGYLQDETLSGPAARALAVIGTEKAEKMLLAALMHRPGTAKTQIDVLTAIADARVEGAEEVVRGFLGSSDPDIQKSVFYALSRVGSEVSLKDLADAAARTGYGFDKTGATGAYLGLIKRIAGQNRIAVAEKAAKDLLKNAAKAGKLETRIAALEILFYTESSDKPDKKTNHVKWVLEAMKDSNREYRNAALNLVSGYADKEMYIELIKTMAKADPEVKADILNWIGREAEQPAKQDLIRNLEIRFDLPAKQVLVAQLDDLRKGGKGKEFDEELYRVKEATVWTLVKIGDPSFIPVLAHLLGNGEKRIVLLAQNALAAFPGDVDASVAKVIPTAENAGKIAGLELLAMRNATANINTVLGQVKSDSPEVRAAAYVALKDVVGERDLVNVCGMLETADALAIPPLQRAVIASLSGMPVEKRAEFVTQRMLQAGDRKKYLYYRVLASTGDKEALNRIAEDFYAGSEVEQKAAFDALLNWENREVADVLFDICGNKSFSSYFDPAFSKYVEWTSDASFTAENRLLNLRKAMEIARTDVQKISVIQQIEKTGTFPGLMYAGEFLNQKSLQQVAANAVMNIALNHPEYAGKEVRLLLGEVMKVLDNPDAGYQKEAIKKYLNEMPEVEKYELSPEEQKEGFQVLFDGTNMDEWVGNTVDYVLREGCISMVPSKSFGGNLYTRKEYANFIYRFEFQLTPAANNGIGIRTPLEGDAAYVGMEIQILDCEHPVYKDITPLQHHGSVYGIIPAKAHASKPAGEWNTQEIRADGDHIRVTVNGIVILDGNIRDAVKNGTPDGKEHPGLFNKKGHIGFLGHGSAVKFRNIRIKELK